MAEENKQTAEADEKGVPWTNRMKEMERKFQEKYDQELEMTRKELEELKAFKASLQEPEPKESEEAAKAELMEFVKNPRGFIRGAFSEAEFQRQIPEAESWIRQQTGYSSEDDVKIAQIIKENKLDTPYHAPMDRAKTAWRLLNAERQEKETSKADDERRREEAAAKSAVEGTGKATSKEQTVTRADVIRKLAEAEAKGDLDAAIKYTGLLEDIR